MSQTKTTRLKLNKPQGTDFVLVSDLNENMDIVEATLTGGQAVTYETTAKAVIPAINELKRNVNAQPKILDNGNWGVWNGLNGYTDTGVKADVSSASTYAEQQGDYAKAQGQLAQTAATGANTAGQYAETIAKRLDVVTATANTLTEGSRATATVAQNENSTTFTFGIPKGDTGATPIVEIGTVTTVEPNQSASVVPEAISGGVRLNFSIPRGAQGDRGSVEGIDPATDRDLGGVIVGSGLSVTADGTLSANIDDSLDASSSNAVSNSAVTAKLNEFGKSLNNVTTMSATADKLGMVKVGDGLTVEQGKVSVNAGDGLTIDADSGALNADVLSVNGKTGSVRLYSSDIVKNIGYFNNATVNINGTIVLDEPIISGGVYLVRCEYRVGLAVSYGSNPVSLEYTVFKIGSSGPVMYQGVFQQIDGNTLKLISTSQTTIRTTGTTIVDGNAVLIDYIKRLA